MIDILKNIFLPGYKTSNYNFFVKIDNNMVVGDNLMYRNLLLFDVDDLRILTNGTVLSVEDDIVKQLIEYRFIIKSDFDELNYYKYQYLKFVYRDNVLNLVILPTLSCNMSCPYCYERKEDVCMNSEIEDYLVSWINENIEDKTILSIDWFGGEPMLRMGTIKRLSNRIISRCEQKHIFYEASITTNGFFLTENNIKVLDDLHIYNVQVTLDGDKDRHNQQKFLKTGEGTYDVLIKNIESYCKLSKSGRPIRIRINVSDANYEYITSLLDSLSDTIRTNSIIFFRWVYANEASKWISFSDKHRGLTPYKGISALLDIAAKKGFNIDNRCDNLQYNYCEADSSNYYTIDPRGYIYLCVHDYQPKNAIGHISTGLYPSALSKYYSFRNINHLNDLECLACKVLPICNGGCRKSRLIGKKQCIEEKSEMSLYVRNIYEKYKNNY